MKIYEWRGFQYQIADEDLKFYPGAVEVKEKKVETETKAKEAPKNKASQKKNK